MQITEEHKVAMWCLPSDGRWQSEAQLIGQSRLGARTCRIYCDLVGAEFCERKVVPILCGLMESGEFVRMYRRTFTMNRNYCRALKQADQK